MKKRILLVEDEENIRDMVVLNLEMEGYHVTASGNGVEALQFFGEQKFDLLILDIMLPGKDGLSLCEAIRLRDRTVPILFLSAKGSTEDRIAGLKMGGDDYLPKPFNLEELLLRVHKLLKRSAHLTNLQIKDTEIVHFCNDGCFINFDSFEARGINGTINLTQKEAQLLKLLVDNEGEVVSRNRILETVWGYNVYPSTRTIDNFILAFRKYFESDPKNPHHFISVRGVGYKFQK
ncbi:MAG: response regulator transcription factor [Bacteroidetes bacterium]|nr:response regulator transcription factor [Bacteroidota bacterium]